MSPILNRQLFLSTAQTSEELLCLGVVEKTPAVSDMFLFNGFGTCLEGNGTYCLIILCR